jgi:ligand-binding SRPBCC domain-containing protein
MGTGGTEMPMFESETKLNCSPALLFDFLARPANLSKVWPPELHARVTDSPERLALGSRFTVRVRRFGIPRSITSEIVAFEEGVAFTDRQVAGPFAAFEQSHRVEPDGPGCRMIDRIEYAAPGGWIGLYLTNERIRRDLAASFRHRAVQFRGIFG